MGHDTTVFHGGVSIVSPIAGRVVINHPLVPLFDIVLPAIVGRGCDQRKLHPLFIGRTVVRERELVPFGVVIVEGVRILVFCGVGLRQ